MLGFKNQSLLGCVCVVLMLKFQMKRIYISAVISLFFIFPAFADIGCSDGTYIYTLPTGTTLNENAANHIPRYDSGTIYRIYMMTYSGDKCGYPTNKPLAVPPNSQNLNPRSACVIGVTGSGYGAGLVYFTPSLNSCPIDDYVPLMLAFAGCTGFFFLRQKLPSSLSVSLRP